MDDQAHADPDHQSEAANPVRLESFGSETDEERAARMLADIDVVIFTDDPAFSADRVRSICLDRQDADRTIAEIDPLAVRAAAAGKKIITWASKQNARSLARRIVQELDPVLPEGRVLHITLQEPTHWLDDPTANIETLIQSATTTLPAARPQTGSLADSQAEGITVERGKRGEWTRAAVKELLRAGLENDEASLYESTRLRSGTPGSLALLDRREGPDTNAKLVIPEGTLLIGEADYNDICARLDDAAPWHKLLAARYAKEPAPYNPTTQDAQAVIARYRVQRTTLSTPAFRTLTGIVDAPSIRRDGTLIVRPGYDDTTSLYADFPNDKWTDLDAIQPSLQDARKALSRIYDVVQESPFAEPVKVNRAVWAALVLTLVGRYYAAGNVPLFAFTANAPGAGKGTLVDLAATIATGRISTKWAPIAGRTEDRDSEDRKRLVTIAQGGTRIVCIDNIKAGEPLGSPALDGAITAGDDDKIGMVADRALGRQETIEAPFSVVLCATGNNLRVVGDMARRTLLCRLHAEDDPAAKQYSHHPRVLEFCRKNRVGLLRDALTVLVAHRDALRRRDAQSLPSIPSFGGWSDRIRSAIAWADPDGADPWGSNATVKAEAQPEEAAAVEFLAAWYAQFQDSPITTSDVERACDDDKELSEGVQQLNIAPPRSGQAFNLRSLGTWLGNRKDQPGGYVVHKRGRKWFVTKTLPKAEGPARTKVAIPDDSALGKLLLVAAPTKSDLQRFPLLSALIVRTFQDQDALYHVPTDDDQLGLPIPTWEAPGRGERMRNGDGVTKEAGEWDSDGAPARVDFAPKWAQKTAPGRLLWMARHYPDVMGGDIQSMQFRESIGLLLEEAALLVPENQRADWIAAAKAEAHVARHLQEPAGN